MQSQYSPMGSRMPSRQGSSPFKGGERPHGSVDSGTGTMGPMDESPPDHLETIESVQTHSAENVTAMTGGARFTQEQLEEAMKKAGAA